MSKTYNFVVVDHKTHTRFGPVFLGADEERLQSFLSYLKSWNKVWTNEVIVFADEDGMKEYLLKDYLKEV